MAPRTLVRRAAPELPGSKGTYLAARYAHLRGRRGHPKAVVAVGHSILVIVYHLLATAQRYSDISAAHFLERHGSETYKRRLIANLDRLGYAVNLEPAA